MAAVLVLIGATAALRLDVEVGPHSLAKAQARVRAELQGRRSGTGPCQSDDIEVRLGPGRHSPPPGGLVFSAEDAGVAGCFKVVWSGADDGGTAVDGGLHITTAWTRVDASKNLWSTPAPAEALQPHVLPVRTMYVDNVRYNRTRDDPSTFALLGSDNSVITAGGYEVTSAAPQAWTDPTTVEIVKQGAFTQDRCPIATVAALGPAPPSRPSSARTACAWGQKLEGRSPGSSIEALHNITSWAACQAECCKRENATKPCASILYKSAPVSLCYITDRDVLPSFSPAAGMFVANMNPAPVTYRTAVNISQLCLSTGRGYKYGQNGYPTYVENTGNFTLPGQFYLDRKKGLLLATFLPEHNPSTTGALPVVLGLHEMLMSVHDTHDVEWHNLTFEHSAWTQVNDGGYIERFSNLYFNLEGHGYLEPAAAVVVRRSHRLTFDGCTWTRLGAFGLLIQNATQDVTVQYCTFVDLSGGAVMLGSTDDNVAEPATQLARLTIADNTMAHVSREYTGAAAVHSMVVANSTLEHNLITDVGYCGISWNWPATQGPTFPFPPTDPALGYNDNNVVANNDVSHFMRETTDGGGIHSVGSGGNTTYSGNYFHDVSAAAVSIIYVDNWAAGFTINDNVVDNCPNATMGYYYFQSIQGCPAHDNHVDGLFARASGDPTKHGLNCNCTNVVNVPTGSPWPEGAAKIIANSGPRAKANWRGDRARVPGGWSGDGSRRLMSVSLNDRAAPAQCNASFPTACPKLEDCCASQYSPTKIGCTVDIGNTLWSKSQGCGDGLPADGKKNTTVCCKPGPGLPPSTTLKNVLIIGDSVSIGYTTLATKSVPKLLASTAQVQHGPWDVSDGGAKDTAMGVACLDRWLMTQDMRPVRWDVIAFNFGLHNMNNSSWCEALYREQLTNITERLAALGTKILYVDTTPFMPRRAIGSTVVEDMNAIAKQVVSKHISAPIVDLYGEVTKTCGKLYTDCPICRVHPCKFHYDDVGMNAQAAIVAAAITSVLGE